LEKAGSEEKKCQLEKQPTKENKLFASEKGPMDGETIQEHENHGKLGENKEKWK
jgi:hypothetical protein